MPQYPYLKVTERLGPVMNAQRLALRLMMRLREHQAAGNNYLTNEFVNSHGLLDNLGSDNVAGSSGNLQKLNFTIQSLPKPLTMHGTLTISQAQFQKSATLFNLKRYDGSGVSLDVSESTNCALFKFPKDCETTEIIATQNYVTKVFNTNAGPTGPKGDAGRDGNFGGASFDYTFERNSGTIVSDLSNGKVIIVTNNAQKDSTMIQISYKDDNQNGITNFMDSIRSVDSDIKAILRIVEKHDSSNFLQYTISNVSALHPNNSFYLTVAYVAGSSDTGTVFTPETDIILTFALVGNRGTQGNVGPTGAQGIQGIQGQKGDPGSASAAFRAVLDVKAEAENIQGNINDGEIQIEITKDSKIITDYQDLIYDKVSYADSNFQLANTGEITINQNMKAMVTYATTFRINNNSQSTFYQKLQIDRGSGQYSDVPNSSFSTSHDAASFRKSTSTGVTIIDINAGDKIKVVVAAGRFNNSNNTDFAFVTKDSAIHIVDLLGGEKGNVGPTGLQGLTGAQGIQGIQGPTGDKGDKGDIGPTGADGNKIIYGNSAIWKAMMLSSSETIANEGTIALNAENREKTENGIIFSGSNFTFTDAKGDGTGSDYHLEAGNIYEFTISETNIVAPIGTVVTQEFNDFRGNTLISSNARGVVYETLNGPTTKIVIFAKTGYSFIPYYPTVNFPADNREELNVGSTKINVSDIINVVARNPLPEGKTKSVSSSDGSIIFDAGEGNTWKITFTDFKFPSNNINTNLLGQLSLKESNEALTWNSPSWEKVSVSWMIKTNGNFNNGGSDSSAWNLNGNVVPVSSLQAAYFSL